MTLGEMSEQLRALRALRVSGERRVRFGDREVEYRTDVEIASAIADLERRISAEVGSRVRTVRFHSTRTT